MQCCTKRGHCIVDWWAVNDLERRVSTQTPDDEAAAQFRNASSERVLADTVHTAQAPVASDSPHPGDVKEVWQRTLSTAEKECVKRLFAVVDVHGSGYVDLTKFKAEHQAKAAKDESSRYSFVFNVTSFLCVAAYV